MKFTILLTLGVASGVGCGVECGVGCGGSGMKATGEEVAEDPAPEVEEFAGEMTQWRVTAPKWSTVGDSWM